MWILNILWMLNVWVTWIKYLYDDLIRSYIKRFAWSNLYDSQSLFRFSLRLHFHTSCSYRVHISCSYRVFSLQEFYQNESRTNFSCINTALISMHSKSLKKRQKREVGMNRDLKGEKTLDFRKFLLAQLQLGDKYNHKTIYEWLLKTLKKYFSW